MTSVMRNSPSDWIDLMTPSSKCRRLLVAHFIRLSVSAKTSIAARMRSDSKTALAANKACQSSAGMPSPSAAGSNFATSKARRHPISSPNSCERSRPLSDSFWINDRAVGVSRDNRAVARFATFSREVKPKTSSTFSSTIRSPQKATSWSSIDCASRMPPSAPLAIAHAAA